MANVSGLPAALATIRPHQSAGISINVTAELDQALLAKPQELQHQIAELYQQAAQTLDEAYGFESAVTLQKREAP